MIDPLNDILRDLIQSRIAALAAPTQVCFEPPDDAWAHGVATAGEERLNIYLYDLRENRKLRTNERTRTPQDGWYLETHFPPRLDCHYVITAWSPAVFNPGTVEPTKDEHVRLYEVLAVLMRHRPLAAREVYAPGIPIPSGRTIAAVPAPLATDDLPLEAVAPDDVRHLGDFWTTMRRVWKPVLELVVTIPVVWAEDPVAQAVVTTVLGDYGIWGGGAMTLTSPERLLTIGGHVLQGTPPLAVTGAWVQLVGLAPVDLQAINRRAITSAQGQFRFDRLHPGLYRLRTVALGLGAQQRDVELPSPTGEYDLRLP